MTAWMNPPGPPNPRKRVAPGASPIGNIQMPNQSFNPQRQQVGNNEYMWNQTAIENPIYPELNYNTPGYGANTVSNPQYPQGIQAPSTQLARRPNQHMVQQRSFHNPNEWALTDDVFHDPSVQNSGLAENDSIERLEERAAAAKRDAQSKRKQIPPFVQKLNSFLDDGKNTDLIRWSERGDSFVVLDEDEFAKTLIPELFKHNNYASFVRQLNMYGFHKRVGLSDNSMKASERKNKSPSEYYNPYFKRGHPNLLWLINKPKNPQKKGKGRTKQEEGAEESDEDNKDNIEEAYGYGDHHGGIPRAISAAPGEGPTGPVALTVVQKQLRDIQQQQNNISNMIARLRKEHQDLYQQADAFTQLHNRHESSINAILTFLATVYNRSLDNNGGAQNIMQMFGNIPQQEQHHQGNVVDLGNVSQNQANGNVSPMRRPPRLLMPPTKNQGQTTGHISNVSTPLSLGKSSSDNCHKSVTTPQSGAIEEVFENSPQSRSPEASGSASSIKPDPSAANSPQNGSAATTPQINRGGQEQGVAQGNIMDLINSTNKGGSRQKDMPFPDVLSHYEHANGQSPLTNQQRDQMLDLMTSTGVGSQGLNVLSSPAAPLDMNQMGLTQQQIDGLMEMQREQDNKISQVSNILGPMTPGGRIPGVEAQGGYFGDVAPSPGVDLDQFLDAGAYYNPEVGDNAFGFGGGYNNDSLAPGLDFTMGMDGITENQTGEVDGESAAAGEKDGSPKRRRMA